MLRHGRRAAICLAALALFAATLCSLQWMDAIWIEIPQGKHFAAAFQAFLLVALCGMALLAAVKTADPADPFESIWHGTVHVGSLVAVWVGLWMTFVSTPPRLLVHENASTGLARPAGPVNVLLVVLDTVRGDHLDLFGYERETMPNLRRFAREECQVVMPMFTTAPWTAPSHGSMFTGLYPSVHGAHYPFLHDESPTNISYPLRDDVPTLAEFLAAQGYQTAGIGANFVILSAFGLPRGFEYYDVTPGSSQLASSTAWFYRFHVGTFPSPAQVLRDWLPDSLQRRSAVLSGRQPPYRRANEITDGAIRWLGENADRPFFLFLNYFDAHTPYLPPPDDDARFAPRPPGEQWRTFPSEQYSERTWGTGEFTPQEQEFLVAQYDAELVAMDREVGRLVHYLRDSGLLEDTLVLVTADHGESLFDRGFLGHGNTLYEAETGGFLIAKTPATLGEVQPSPLMQFVDFFPTIADAIEAPIPPHVQGTLWGHGRNHALLEVFCRDCAYNAGAPSGVFRRELVAVVADGRKVIRSTSDPDEVYALSGALPDPESQQAPDAEFLKRAEAILDQRNANLSRSVTANPPDEEFLRKARSLGYVK